MTHHLIGLAMYFVMGVAAGYGGQRHNDERGEPRWKPSEWTLLVLAWPAVIAAAGVGILFKEEDQGR